jgi:hypothetical protein
MLKSEKDLLLWGAESALLSKILFDYHYSTFRNSITAIINTIYIKGKVLTALDINKMIVDNYHTEEENGWDKIKIKILSVLDVVDKKAEKHYTTQIYGKDAIKKAERDPIYDAIVNRIEEYVDNYPDRILKPELQDIVDRIKASPELSPMSMSLLQEKIERLRERGEEYFSKVADVELGREWMSIGLHAAQEAHIERYMVLAQVDDPNAPCEECQMLHGHVFSVVKAIERMDSILGDYGVEEPPEAAKFPSADTLAGLDNDELEEEGYFPPFHPHCRCDLIFLGEEIKVIEEEHVQEEISVDHLDGMSPVNAISRIAQITEESFKEANKIFNALTTLLASAYGYSLLKRAYLSKDQSLLPLLGKLPKNVEKLNKRNKLINEFIEDAPQFPGYPLYTILTIPVDNIVIGDTISLGVATSFTSNEKLVQRYAEKYKSDVTVLQVSSTKKATSISFLSKDSGDDNEVLVSSASSFFITSIISTYAFVGGKKITITYLVCE